VLWAAAPAAALRRALREVWDLEDAGLLLRPYERHGLVQLQTPRIYPDPAVAEKALRVRPGAVGALAYLVNSISSPNGKSTPYSFMVALSPSEDRRLSPVPPDLRDDEILINRWVSDRLAVGPGDRVKVAYSELSEGDAFVEREREFTVRAVLEMESLGAERDLVPEFPGLTDVDRCEEWDIGLPLEERKLKDADNEAYWKAYRQTPKAVVSLAAGRSMWGNRFGDLMTVRYRLEEEPAVRATLRDRLDPEDAGLRTRAVREEAARAVAESTDLGQLFLGMSAFLAAASLVLTGLLFGFTVDQRAREAGTLRALGFTPRQVRGLLLSEGALLAVGGTLAGIPLGLGLARVLVWGLGTAWSGAVARAAVEVRVRSGSILAGAAAAAGL
ncbi:MAG: ABC transporter permease, partial [Planctomycetota bacterium]